ncbi:MAG TPA: hypothetical protein VLE22_11870 [Bryobacteraceae bacterium]|nr:hypothetical protein [Bryobacteraceae bacterium]
MQSITTATSGREAWTGTSAGVSARNTLHFDGRNLWDAIASNKQVAREDLHFTIESRDGFHFAVRQCEWKLVRHEPRPSGGAVNQLYRLDEDPQETRDVAAHPALRDGEFSLT